MLRNLILLLLIVSPILSQAQDYYITWKSDTVYCTLPENPRKEGIKPSWKYNDGFSRFIAIKNDSVHTLLPGKIKAYSRSKHGSRLLCNGYFESMKVSSRNNRNETEWVFLNRLYKGKYASLYIRYVNTGKAYARYYYLVEHETVRSQDPVEVFGRKELIKILGEKDPTGTVSMNLKKKKKRSEIVEQYNLIKDELERNKEAK